MSSTKWAQIENIQFQFTKYCRVRYNHEHQVLNILYSNPLGNIQYLFLDDTRTAITLRYSSMIKGGIIVMMTLLKTDTNNILQITNLLNNFPMFTTEKKGDIQTLGND